MKGKFGPQLERAARMRSAGARRLQKLREPRGDLPYVAGQRCHRTPAMLRLGPMTKNSQTPNVSSARASEDRKGLD